MLEIGKHVVASFINNVRQFWSIFEPPYPFCRAPILFIFCNRVLNRGGFAFRFGWFLGSEICGINSSI